jgi:acyl-CoA synthetase (AMP-forming)/AMP-acid ligase II
MSAGQYTDLYADEDIQKFRAAGLWADDTLFDLVVRNASQHPDKVFATDGQRSVTYGELARSAVGLAAGLTQRGWRAGDTVAVQLPNWVEFIEVSVALSRLGIVIVPIMPIYRYDEVGYVLRNADVRGVIIPAVFNKFDYLKMYCTLRAERSGLEILVVRPDGRTGECIDAATGIATLGSVAVSAAAQADLPAPTSADDPFVIVYTSGTTARPKGCIHTFNTYCAGARSLSTAFGYTSADVQFGPSPVTHTTGLVTNVLLPLLNGAATHLMAEWDPVRGLAEIARRRCTLTVTATTFLQMLLNAYEPERDDASSLRLWVCAGAPIPPAVVEKSTATLADMKVLSLYGRSENLCTTTCSIEDDPSRALNSDGTAMPGHDVAIVDHNGEELARGTEGDIAYRGPSHMIGYLNNASETAALFTEAGFSRSGDLGVMDDDGFVRVTGRTKDIIIRGGTNISAREIEDLLAGHPALSDSAVVGIPDERLGERVGCVIVVHAGRPMPTVDELQTFLTDRGIAIQKTPERLIRVENLPMTATGKVQKHILREVLAESVANEPVVAPR